MRPGLAGGLQDSFVRVESRLWSKANDRVLWWVLGSRKAAFAVCCGNLWTSVGGVDTVDKKGKAHSLFIHGAHCP